MKLAQKTDFLGRNQLAIDLRFHEQDAASVERVHQEMSIWLQSFDFARLELKCRRSEVVARVLDQAKHGTHQLGMTRMALSANGGVVNGDLQTFDLPNLYLCSGSVLPTSSQANPTLTIAALGIRLASHIAGVVRSR